MRVYAVQILTPIAVTMGKMGYGTSMAMVEEARGGVES